MSELVTGEAVELELRTASLPSRVVATGLDTLLQLLVVLVLGIAFAVSSIDLSEAAGAALGVVLLVLVLAGYPIGFETLLRGRTPGKAAMGLRVVRDDGGPIGFRQAFVRGLSAAFLEKPGVTGYLLGSVLILGNRRDKRMGDLLAGTVVVRERLPSRGGFVATMPPQLTGWAAGLELSRLPDDLALSVRQFLARSGELTPAAREQLGTRLVEAVRALTAPPPPLGTPGWAFLSAVLAERRRRESERLRPAAPRPTAPPAAAWPSAAGSPAPTAPAPAVAGTPGDDPGTGTGPPPVTRGGFTAPS